MALFKPPCSNNVGKMGQKDFGELYKFLFGLGMIIVLVDLKCDGQYSRFMHCISNVYEFF